MKLSKKNKYKIFRNSNNLFIFNNCFLEIKKYVIITSINPLKFFLYKKDEKNLKKFFNEKKEEENYDKNNINKKRKILIKNIFIKNLLEKEFFEFLNFKEIEKNNFNYKIRDIIIKTILSIVPILKKNLLKINYNNNCFEIFELKFHIKKNKNPILIKAKSFLKFKNEKKNFDPKNFYKDIFNLIGVFPKLKEKNLILKKNNFIFENEMNNFFLKKIFIKNLEIDIISELIGEIERMENFQFLYPNYDFENYEFLIENGLNDNILKKMFVNKYY